METEYVSSEEFDKLTAEREARHAEPSLKWQDITEGQWIHYNAPRIEGMMTGVARAIQLRDGSIELTYADTTTESAECGDLQISEAPSLFAVVDTVQSRARDGSAYGW